MNRQRVPSAMLVVAIAFVYFAAGRFGLSLALVNPNVSGIWPASGIALAACLLVGNRVLPAIFVASFAVNILTSHVVWTSLAIAAGNTLECLAAATLVRRFARGLSAFDNAAAILVFAESTLPSAMIGATVGLLALLSARLLTPDRLSEVWLTWWLGDAAGMLIITPLIVTWVREPLPRWSWMKIFEALCVFASAAAVSYTMFAGPAAQRRYPLTFLPFPVLLWVALRFGPRETMTAILVLAAAAVEGTMRGVGPFAGSSPVETQLLLLSFLATITVPSFALAAEAARRRESDAQVRQLNAELTKRVEVRTDELRRSHGRLAEAQHVARVGSWDWNLGDDSVWWSEELYRIYDVPVGTRVNYATFLNLVHPDDRVRIDSVVQHAIATAEPFAFEYRVIRSDGGIRHLSGHGRVRTDENGRTVRMMGIGHDITERKQAEEERVQLLREQAARREAEESNRTKDHFLATLSHELRTPLNAILGWAEILRSPRTDEETRNRAIEAISRNVSIQAQLVSDILDVARIRAGTLYLQPRPIVLTEVISGALEIVGPMLDAKRIGVRVTVPPEANSIVADAQRLRQIFWNLLSNAAKFAPEGGHVDIRASSRPDGVSISVEDDGPGIDPAFLPRVFEQFSQADGTVMRQYGGLGLGLAITHHLVRLHNGDIDAGNRPQGGAIFTVRLPLRATAA